MCLYIYIKSLQVQEWSWTLLCKCRYKLHMIHSNIFLWKGNASSLHCTILKIIFIVSCCFFEIEEECLMTEHSKDRCERGIYVYIWNETIVPGSLVWELSDMNSQDKELQARPHYRHSENVPWAICWLPSCIVCQPYIPLIKQEIICQNLLHFSYPTFSMAGV